MVRVYRLHLDGEDVSGASHIGHYDDLAQADQIERDRLSSLEEERELQERRRELMRRFHESPSRKKGRNLL